MTNLPVLKGRQVIAALEKGGFVVVSVKKHVKLRHPDGRITMVPNHPGKDVLPATLDSVLRRADVTADEFRSWL